MFGHVYLPRVQVNELHEKKRPERPFQKPLIPIDSWVVWDRVEGGNEEEGLNTFLANK